MSFLPKLGCLTKIENEQVAVAVEGEMEETQNWLKGYLGLGPPYWVSLATQTPDIAWGLVALE